MGFAATLADKLDPPLRASYARLGQRAGRHATDLPAGKRGRRRRQWIFADPPPPLQHQCRCSMLFGRKLKPARGSHAGAADFAYDCGKPAVPKTFLHDGKHLFVAAAFRLDEAFGRKANLRQARGKQIAPLQRPEHGSVITCPSCGNGGRKQRRCGVIAEAGIGPCDLMQSRSNNPAADQSPVDAFHSERQRLSLLSLTARLDGVHLGPKGSELLPRQG